MTLSQPSADLFVPDGTPLPEALARTTHLGIGAHQDDLEFFAYHGIAACFQQPGEWFGGVIVTNGAGSARDGVYARYTDAEMIEVRRREQRKAAAIGEYGAMIQLGHASGALKDAAESNVVVDDLVRILEMTKPDYVYVHNPADKHDTHVALLVRCLAALRKLPAAARPKRVYGCEVWRDLDWVPDERKVVLPVSDRPNLQAALNGVFDSQISGGKRYDLAVMGRRLAHATFHESHEVDTHTGLTFALDLTALARDETLTLSAYLDDLLHAFSEDVKKRVDRFSGQS
ncbi:MAG: PIG-L family deacetylase [Verrucomicrobiota bacterium]